MPELRIEPQRAVEIISPSYGSGYRIGGRLVLTASHVVTGAVGHTCTVRARQAFGNVEARVAWQAPGADVALVQLPEEVPTCDAVVFGRLPAAGQTALTIPFESYGWPKWARTTRRGETPKAGGRHIVGDIHLADTSPEGLLVLEPKRVPEAPSPQAQDSEWTGMSGAAVLCSGLVVAVQHHHQNPRRAASLEAVPLAQVYDDPHWRSLLEQHGIHGEPRALFDASPQRYQAYCAQVIKAITSRLKALEDGALINKIAREIQQLTGAQTSGLDMGSEPDDLPRHIATCMVEHKAVTDVVGCLIYLMQDLPLDVAARVADIIDVVLPFNYAPDMVQRLHTQLTEERFGLVESAVTTLTLAEILMAGYDQKPASFVVMKDDSAGMRGKPALTPPPQEPEEGPGDLDADDAHLLPAVRNFLYDLRCCFDRVPDRARGIQSAIELHREIDGHATWLRGRLRAHSQRHRRTIYCVLQLPEASPQRDWRKRVLRTVSAKLNQEGAVLVFVEWMADTDDSRESEVEDHIAYIQHNIRTRYMRTQPVSTL